ncbi:hypothetical protein HMPREF3153_01750 [Corynebacterium sp. HMSC06C06]|nr:hypothetical protein HMPREF3153_01750 [Corynebacterium sp. HMSC06C06]
MIIIFIYGDNYAPTENPPHVIRTKAPLRVQFLTQGTELVEARIQRGEVCPRQGVHLAPVWAAAGGLQNGLHLWQVFVWVFETRDVERDVHRLVAVGGRQRDVVRCRGA